MTAAANSSERKSRNPRFPIPGGLVLRARGWRQEGLLRLLENVLCVGEDPDNLIVYAALGKAARNWAAHYAIVSTLKSMSEDETLVIQSGKPIGVLKTHVRAPLVIMANCNIVGHWATAEVFYDLQKKGLICWGGLTAGAWQYIGSQGVLQGTYEIFMRVAEEALRRRPTRPFCPHRRAWRDGRLPTAGWNHGGRCDPLRRSGCRARPQTSGCRLPRTYRA
jgi:urocanate hydratase